MYKLGHCGGDVRLRNIISGHLEVRDFYDHEEDDVGGYIADFKRHVAVRGRAIPHRRGRPVSRLSLRRRRPAAEALDEVVPARRARIEAVQDIPRNERNIPVITLSPDVMIRRKSQLFVCPVQLKKKNITIFRHEYVKMKKRRKKKKKKKNRLKKRLSGEKTILRVRRRRRKMLETTPLMLKVIIFYT
ncbi:PREDICTED: uncharacterized protein LOC108768656 [Trachymyrmex cornetzi]|uniref:uncharacterized protein LOC108768656 n=1 Tax=Trachymyrmex cornetzi TaxID=471704 RepID=UPI00084F71E5|nr:PREDICTED: uncharacterized protein LOC108768656 [Trachymyrmex cornetzi]